MIGLGRFSTNVKEFKRVEKVLRVQRHRRDGCVFRAVSSVTLLVYVRCGAFFYATLHRIYIGKNPPAELFLLSEGVGPTTRSPINTSILDICDPSHVLPGNDGIALVDRVYSCWLSARRHNS